MLLEEVIYKEIKKLNIFDNYRNKYCKNNLKLLLYIDIFMEIKIKG